MHIFERQKKNGCQESGILSHDSSGRYSVETHRGEKPPYVSVRAEASGRDSQGKYYAHKHIHSVHDKVRHHRAHAILHAYEPAFERHQAESGRSRPYPYEEIFRSQVAHLGSAVHHEEGCLDEYPLDCYQSQGTGKRYTEGPGQDPCTLLPVTLSEGLRRQSSCSDAKKTKIPVEQVKEHRAYGDSAYHGRHRPVQMTGHSDIHHSHNRDGYVGKDAGNCQFQYVSVDCSHKRHCRPDRQSSTCICLPLPACRDTKNSGHM